MTNPSGSEAAKKRRSSAVKRSPAQPRTTARGSLFFDRARSPRKDAPEVAPLQFTAQLFGRCRIAERTGQHAIVDALVAEIGADRDGGKLAQQIRVFTLQPGPIVARGLRA